MKLSSTPHFDRRLSKRIKKKSKLKRKISQQLKLLIEDANNPSLRLHRLKEKRAQEYAVWIEEDIRIILSVIPILCLISFFH